jgi:hypothetical protein
MSQHDNHAHLAFNRGLLSPLGLGRIDLKRTTLSAETQTNWIARVLGSAMLRPGFAYKGSTKDDEDAVFIPFVFSSTDKALLEFTEDTMRVWIDGEVLTRPSVSSAVTNGDFTSNITTGWTDSDEAGATSSWSAGALAMKGDSTGTAYCKQDQEVSVSSGDQGVEHALRITVSRGPVEVKVGTTQGGQDYFGYSLGTGVHSLSFTPTGNFWIRVRSRETYTVLLNDINVESSGSVEIGTDRDGDDIENLRYTQSGDVVFIACTDNPQTKVERRATRSWSWVDYEANQGPFLTQNLETTTLLPSWLTGDITLTASKPLFESTHVGSLFKIDSSQQDVRIYNVLAENTWTSAILVTGVGDSRLFKIKVQNITDSIVTLQTSTTDSGPWSDVVNWTEETTETYDDGLDNQVTYYRIGVKTGDYGTDSPYARLFITSGSITGICKITAVSSSTSASAITLQDFGSFTDASSNWSEGQWSEKNGYPSAVTLHEGRLWWAGKDKLNGSVSDSFYNYDSDYEGDAAPINRSIGQGPVDNINWLSSGKVLFIGCDGSVKSVRSSSLDEPLTTTNIAIKDIVTQGAATVPAVKIDGQVVFLQASGIRVYEVGFDSVTYDFSNIDLTAIVPEIGEPSVSKIVIQRQPDTRVHCVRSDGKVALLVYDKVEDVKCWVLVETDGLIEDAVVLPGTAEDEVYYVVNRTIGGSTKRFLEQWTLESENKGEATTKLADSHIIYSGASATTITGLDHLNGESVVVWGNTKDLGTYTVASGQITLSEVVTWCCVGLTYTADFKSAKPALSTAHGSSLLQKKIISQLGLLLANTHAQGLTYGPDFDHLDDLPAKEDGADVDDDQIWVAYDEEGFAFAGAWDTDSRVCLRATAPKPCTLLALVVEWNTNEKV